VTDQAIFLRAGTSLTPLRETPYDDEPLLQKALADYPELLAGSATTGSSGRLLLVRREMPVPGGASGLSLDHLFVDDDGVPVLVEVKRSTDTRSRREVVAQMLDYAANGTAYWPVDSLRTYVETTAGDGQDASVVLAECLGVEEPDRFWRTVEDNLRAGRVRLIFLADRLAPELVRIIEFLNEQMRDTEVLGIELPQFVGLQGAVVYVPRVVGRTAAAVDTKRGTTPPAARWNRESMLAAAAAVCRAEEISLIERLLEDVSERSGRIWWGNGKTAGFTGWYRIGGKDTPVWNINIGDVTGRGRLYFTLAEFKTRHGVGCAGQLAGDLSQMTPLAAEVARVKEGGWRGWAGLPLTAATQWEERITAAISAAAATEPASDVPG
jgi:hypothetical protein